VVTLNRNSVTDNRFRAMNNTHHLDTSNSLWAVLSANRISVGRDFCTCPHCSSGPSSLLCNG